MNYYFDEFIAVMEEYNDMHSTEKVEELYADEVDEPD